MLACVGYLAVRALTQRSIENIPFTPATETAIREAHLQGRPVLLAFTGSDWCGACKRMDAEVFQTAEFANFAAGRLVLLRIDFPRQTELGPREQEQNRALMQRFDITGFPTVVVIDQTGRECGRLGLTPDGVQGFLADLRRIIEG